jgi:hypothetical protein
MLGARLDDDPKAFARLSHAIRSQASETSWLRVDSTNLDELAKSRLPSISKQIDNFLEWMANQVGDDHLEPVELAAEADLSGAIGLVNMDRFDDLQSHMVADGLIAHVGGECVRLTPAGWARLTSATQPVQTPATDPVVLSQSPAAAYPVEFCDCPECGRRQRSEVINSYSERYDDAAGLVFSITEFSTLRCCGCSTLFVRRNTYFSEEEDHEQDPHTGEWITVLSPQTTTYWPAAARRTPPSWAPQISDTVVQQLLDEVYRALDADLRTLAAMGVRALLDRAFELGGAPAAAGFQQKLRWLTEHGVVSSVERDTLTVMTDAGSAASHRGWRPEFDDLDTILEAAEAVLYRVCVQPAVAQRLVTQVPPRPPQ